MPRPTPRDIPGLGLGWVGLGWVGLDAIGLECVVLRHVVMWCVAYVRVLPPFSIGSAGRPTRI